MMGKWITTSVAVVVSVAMAGLFTQVAADEKAEPRQAPAFTLTDHNGNQVSLSDYANRIVVLEWFNHECPFVVRHHQTKPTMRQLASKYAEHGVVWLAINSSDFSTPALNKEWAEKWNVPYAILDDASGRVGKAYNARTTPHMFIINQQGHIVYDGAIDDDPRGNKKADEIVNYVDKALSEMLDNKAISHPQTRPYGCTVKYAKK